MMLFHGLFCYWSGCASTKRLNIKVNCIDAVERNAKQGAKDDKHIKVQHGFGLFMRVMALFRLAELLSFFVELFVLHF